eukprot:6184887-Pleurochrysis_carterae.AAC.1
MKRLSRGKSCRAEEQELACVFPERRGGSSISIFVIPSLCAFSKAMAAVLRSSAMSPDLAAVPRVHSFTAMGIGVMQSACASNSISSPAVKGL